MEDVGVRLEEVFSLLFASGDSFFHDCSDLNEHRVDVALTDAVEHRSELLFRVHDAGLSLSQALLEFGLPHRGRGFMRLLLLGCLLLFRFA